MTSPVRCVICGELVEPGAYLTYRHVLGQTPRVRSHYARPASRSGADDSTAAGGRARGDARRQSRMPVASAGRRRGVTPRTPRAT